MPKGKRETSRKDELFIMPGRLLKSLAHAFYVKLNQLVAEVEFDRWIKAPCEPYYASGKGRPSISPGTYFRTLLVGYFVGIHSQRGIA